MSEEIIHRLRWRQPVPHARKDGSWFTIEWSGAQVMAIVNVTPDSFSDGGAYDSVEAATEAGRDAWREGALIVDVGGESTRPGAVPVSIDEERRRVLPVIEGLAATGEGLISVDTRHAEVARDALAAGAHVVNDVTGLRDPMMRQVCADAGVPVIVMHMQGEPASMQREPRYDDVVQEVETHLLKQAAQAEASGVTTVVLDPGWGFGKLDEHNLALLQGLPRLAAHGYPVLLGASRKGTLGRLTGVERAEDRDPASFIVHAEAARLGAALVRVHDVAGHIQALAMNRYLSKSGMPDGGLDCVTLEGLTHRGRHGVYAEEAEKGARFVVDLDAFFTFPGDDALGGTVDYARLQECVRIEVEDRRYDLIETLAQRIAERVLELDVRIVETRVTVHKPEAPLPGSFEDVKATVVRRR